MPTKVVENIGTIDWIALLTAHIAGNCTLQGHRSYGVVAYEPEIFVAEDRSAAGVAASRTSVLGSERRNAARDNFAYFNMTSIKTAPYRMSTHTDYADSYSITED